MNVKHTIVLLLVVGVALSLGRDLASSQPTRPQIAGVRNDLLEEDGIFLTTLPDLPDAVPEEAARAAFETRFHMPIKDVQLVLLEKRSPRQYKGPVWAASLSTEGTAFDTVTGGIGVSYKVETDTFIAFIEAKTGDFLFAAQAGHAID